MHSAETMNKQDSSLAPVFNGRRPDSVFDALRAGVSERYRETYGSSASHQSRIEFYASGTEFRTANLLEPLIGKFVNKPPRKILDVGCGYGSIPLFLAWLWPDAQVFATDATDHYFRCGEEARVKLGLPNIQFSRLSAQDLDFDSEFDLVVSCNMLNFLTTEVTLTEALSGFALALENHGDLIIHTPHYWSWREPFTKFPLLHYCPLKVQDTIARRSGKRSLLSDTRNPSLKEIVKCLQAGGLRMTACSPKSWVARMRSTHFTAWFTKHIE